MVARVSGILFDGPLKSVVSGDQGGGTATNWPVTGLRLYKGSLPASLLDSLSDANILSTASVGGSTAGSVSLPYGAYSSWTSPSSGVIILSSPVAIPIRSTGLPVSPIPGFIRLYMSSTPVMDIEVSSVRGSQVAQISSVSAVTASQVLALMDLRLKIATSGPVSFSNSFASAILKQMLSTNQYNPVPAWSNAGYYAGLPFILNYNPSTAAVTSVATAITATAYDGPIPESANAQATGTKLWEKSYSSSSGANIWNVSGNTMDLTHTFTANAIADGVPTYLRILKPEVISTGTSTVAAANYPRFELQVPVGSGGGAANFTVSSFVAGQPATLNPFTISFLLPEAV